MLFKGAIPNLTDAETKAFEELAPVYEPDRSKRLTYDVRRKHQRVELIRLAKRLGREHDEQARDTARIAGERDLPIHGEMPDGRPFRLIRFQDGHPQYLMPLSAVAGDTISTDEVQPGSTNGFSLSGSTVNIGMWEIKSPLTNHQEFASGRVVCVDFAGLGDHATAVAGVLAAQGVVSSAKGMAVSANIHAYDTVSNMVEMATATAEGDLFISNHSYGIVCGWEFVGVYPFGYWLWYGPGGRENRNFGRYGPEAQALDEVVYQGIYHLPVWAVGNDRNHNGSNPWHDPDGWPDGYDTVLPHQVAKNTLVMGAINDIVGGYAGTGSVTMTAFSGWGPTDDGRIKPDLVANGASLYMPDKDSASDYQTKSGTSFSSPSAAGSLALLIQLQQNLHGTNCPLLASTLKALVIHTADEAGPAPGPDYSFGWGLMNTLSAARVITNNAAWESLPHIKEVAMRDGDYISFDVLATSSVPLKVTICWTDPPGAQHPEQTDPTNIVLVNDLDLRVVTPDGLTTNMPWLLDPFNPSNAPIIGDNIRDNVEQVLIQQPTNGWYSVHVTHKGALSNGVQDVSIVVTGNTPTNAPDFYITSIGIVSTNALTQLEWPGVVGALYSVDASTNLLVTNGWTNAATAISAPRELLDWIDEESEFHEIRFYRLKRLR